MQQLILNDGTVLDGHIIDNGDGMIIFVYLNNMSMDAGFAIMKDSAKTSKIRAISFGHEYIYTGYTNIKSISSEYGNCNLVMTKS